MIDLHQLHRRSVHFNHGNQHPTLGLLGAMINF
jgi:hypothetical protein